MQTNPVTANLTYENNRFTAIPGPTLITQEGSYPISFEYVQNKVEEGNERGKWLIDFSRGVETPFGRKKIDKLVYTINDSHSGEISLERNTLITNSIAYQSVGIDNNMASFDTIMQNINISFHFTYKDFSSLNLTIKKWTKLDPTPKMFISYNQNQTSGGMLNKGNINLTYIPFKYSYDFLNTATETDDEKKYYIIDGLAYIASNIEKANFFWNVNLMRYDSVNINKYIPPGGENG